MPTGHPKAALAWAIGPSPNHYRNFRILVKEGKGQCGIQDENQLDFHLPAHVQVHRLPYHAELAAAIKDLTTVLKKTPLTEATGTPTSDDIASLGQSLLEAATHAHRIFGTPQPVAPMHLESDDRYDPHYNQSLSTPEEPMEYKTQPPIANQHLPSIPSPIPKPVHPAPIVPTPPAVQQRVVATPLPATPPAPRQRVVATPTTPRAQRTATPDSLMDLLEKIRNDPNIPHPATAAPNRPAWDPNDLTHADLAVGYAYSATEAILNLNEDGTPLTKNSALKGPHRSEWQTADGIEIRKLLDIGTMKAAHLKETNLLLPSIQRKV